MNGTLAMLAGLCAGLAAGALLPAAAILMGKIPATRTSGRRFITSRAIRSRMLQLLPWEFRRTIRRQPWWARRSSTVNPSSIGWSRTSGRVRRSF